MARFPQYLHGELEPRMWLLPGSKAHKELEIICGNTRLCKAIRCLSQDSQTSSLESYHKVVIFFASKSVHYFL